MGATRRSARLHTSVDAIAVAAAMAYVLWRLHPDLLLTSTITTGGDTASHYLTAEWLRNHLLPAGRVTGWQPGNYAGFPLFQVYFPLPFVGMVLLSAITGLPVAFKLTTVAGLIGLPGAAYAGLRLLGLRFPAPALAAAFTVPFLFHEANSVWGANVASTLAGEFTYSIGTALLLIFAGSLYRGVLADKGWMANGALLAAIGLCHAYTLLAATSLGAYLIVIHPMGRQALPYLVKVGLLAFGLLAFWALPLVAYSEYTTGHSVIWPIRGFTHVVPVLLWPFMALLLVGSGTLAIERWRTDRSRPIDHRLPYLASLAVGSVALYLAAWKLDVVDIRFLPFAQLTLVIMAAVPVAAAIRRLGIWRPRWRVAVEPSAVVMAVVLVLTWTGVHAGVVSHWAAWNYGGFEATPGWPAFADIMQSVKRTSSDPRVVYEHSAEHNDIGTVRAFESLPLFAGASTLEGLYMQSTISSPFVFYIQSEVSRVPSCPLLPYHCGRLDPARAAEHLALFNVSDLITRSADVTEAFEASPDFEVIHTREPFTVFRVLRGAGSYVEPLGYEPVIFGGPDWKTAFFAWFKRPGSGEVPLVRAQPRLKSAWALTGATLPDELPHQALPPDVTVRATLAPEQITIHTTRPGHPLLVKVSYHPRWRTSDGSPVWLASPSFMLVVPEDEDISLIYGPATADYLGSAFTAAALGTIVTALIWRRPHPSDSRRHRSLDVIFEYRRWWGPATIAALAVSALLARMAWVDPWEPHRDGLALFQAEEYAAAEPLFERSVVAAPSSAAALYSRYYHALIAFRTHAWADTLRRFNAFLLAYPDSDLVPEAHFRIAEGLQGLDRAEEAMGRFQHIIETFPTTEWAGYAADRIAAATGRGDL